MPGSRLIAELGINHDGSADVARRLIAAAAAAGAHGVKFQYRNLSTAYAGNARQIGDEILQKEIVRNYLSPDVIVALAREASNLGIEPGISFFTPGDIDDFGKNIDVFRFFKVPSVELTNAPLIRRIEALGRPALISTGAYGEQVIADALRPLDRAVWTPLHCVSNYPVNLVNPRLGYIDHLRRLWGGPVGYSSHDEYWETCLVALARGASVIERHITFDRSTSGLDHSSSSTPDEFRKIAVFARDMSLILTGDGPRVPNQGELLNLQNLGRSYYAAVDIAAGTSVTPEKLALRTPRTGLGQEEAAPLLGRPSMRTIKSGAVIDRSVFEPAPKLSERALAFGQTKKLSLPVRFHDMADLESKIPLGRFEFHLSFGDIARMPDVGGFSTSNRYSVHLPDYVSPTQLMDPFSPDAGQRAASRRILDRTADFAKALQDRTGAEAPVVGSFSVVHRDLKQFFRDHAELLAGYRARGVPILPQWLPPIAWYFGGAVRLAAMNNVGDVDEIKSNRLPICMDICHLAMGDKVFDFKAADVIADLAPLIHHIHIADAAGFDGEGVAFGTGDPSNAPAIAAAMSFDCVKVIEVWQGHLHGGAGFVRALNTLQEMFDGR